MYSFLNDYSETAHPDIITALQNAQLSQYEGYGYDAYSEQVKQKLRQHCQNDALAVHFCLTGTQANLVSIAAMLSPIDGIIACATGHIAANEAGAIEATGHKVLLADESASSGSPKLTDGKLTVAAIAKVRQRYTHQPHVVRPKAVYISNATELGTVYTLEELKTLYAYCQQHEMYLFVDGARLGAALASCNDKYSSDKSSNDKKSSNNNSDHTPPYQQLTLADIARYSDMFWLGGTKMGALFGEAIIIANPKIASDFAIHLKQHGGLLAKGFLLAMQFDVLLKDKTYLDICGHANRMAAKLAQGMVAAGLTLSVPTQTNQVFAILPQSLIDKLNTQFKFYVWAAVADSAAHHTNAPDNLNPSDHSNQPDKLSQPEKLSIVRLVTSWATPEAEVDKFIAMLLD